MPTFTRRQVIGGVGGLAIAGTGLGAFAGQIAALSTDFTIAGTTVTNDTGDVTRVYVEPAFDIRWSGFDEPVGQVVALLEAKLGDEPTYRPVFVMAPVIDGDNDLGSEKPGTSGHYIVIDPENLWEITLFDEDGRPDGLPMPGSPHGFPAYLNGADMGNASDAPPWNGLGDVDPFGLPYGFYLGPAGSTAAFESPADGVMVRTVVDVRLTIALGPGPAAADGPATVVMYNTGEYAVIHDAEREHTLPGTDIVHPAWLTDADLRALRAEGHPAVDVHETSFVVQTVNEPSEQGATVTGTSGAEGRDETPT